MRQQGNKNDFGMGGTRYTRNLLILGDALETLRKIDDECVQCAVTSPPYWGLRDYGVEHQIGLEPSLEGFIDDLSRVFAELHRVLKPDGTLWLNIGDTFTSGDRRYRAVDRKNPARAMQIRPDTPDGLKRKDLIGVPWRLALRLQSDGWYLRTDVIWHKPNAMPESVKDRPTRSHEYVFLLSKSEKYYYDWRAVAEKNGRHLRSVWSINTRPYSGAHFATFPPDLVRPCIRASTRPSDYVLDPFFGSGTVGEVCEQEGRRYVGIELNPEYRQLALRRMKTAPEVIEYGTDLV